MEYFNWQQAGDPAAPYTGASPNVKLIMAELIRRFGGENWGIYVYRPIRGGTAWSTHAFGAAGDWAYQADVAARVRAIDWLIVNHEALGVQMIVDENYDRTWKCWRAEQNGPGWRSGAITTGGPWLHFETNPANWANSTPIADRLTPAPTPPPPPLEDDMTELIQPTNDAAIFLRDGLVCSWVADGNVLSALLAAGIVGPAGARPVSRLALKALELHGPAPVYGVTPSNQPERTKTTDFATWRA